jgi:hypothetical protein
MQTKLTTEISLADAVYGIARIARDEDPEIARVYIETSDQGEYMTSTRVTYRSDIEGTGPDGDAYLDQQVECAVDIEDLACQLGWDDAHGDAPGWVCVNRRGGYYYIDVEEALKADPNQLTLIQPVDLVAGVLGLHIVSHTPLRERACSCGAGVTDMVAHRQHVAEKIVAVLS